MMESHFVNEFYFIIIYRSMLNRLIYIINLIFYISSINYWRWVQKWFLTVGFGLYVDDHLVILKQLLMVINIVDKYIKIWILWFCLFESTLMSSFEFLDKVSTKLNSNLVIIIMFLGSKMALYWPSILLKLM